jgi:hypothetical protein
MDAFAKALLVIGALVVLAVTLAGLVFAVGHMLKSLAPYGRSIRVAACVGVVLFAVTPPAAAFAGLSATEATADLATHFAAAVPTRLQKQLEPLGILPWM